MVRKLFFYFEIALFGGLQLVWMASAVGSLVTAAFAKPARQNAAVSLSPSPPAFGTYLNALPGGPELRHAAHIEVLERPIRDDASRFSGHRFYMHKAVDRALPKIHQGFENECRAHGGVTVEAAEDVIVFRKMLRAEKAGMSPGEQFAVTTCRDAEHSMMAAKIVITARYIGTSKRTGVYIMKAAVANSAYAATVAAIAAENSASERRETEYRIAAERNVKQSAEASQRLAQWQQVLAVGDATHCGYVIELRGPMVQVIFRSRSAWVPRETLVPHDAGNRCRAYD